MGSFAGPVPGYEPAGSAVTYHGKRHRKWLETWKKRRKTAASPLVLAQAWFRAVLFGSTGLFVAQHAGAIRRGAPACEFRRHNRRHRSCLTAPNGRLYAGSVAEFLLSRLLLAPHGGLRGTGIVLRGEGRRWGHCPVTHQRVAPVGSSFSTQKLADRRVPTPLRSHAPTAPCCPPPPANAPTHEVAG